MGAYQRIYDDLTTRLRRVRRKELTISFTSGFMKALGGSAALLTLFTAIEALAFADTGVRTILALVWIGASLGALAYFVGPALAAVLGFTQKTTVDDIALRVGRSYPEVDDKLTNALQLFRMSDKAPGASPELALATFGQVSQQASGLDFDVIVDKEQRKRGLALLASALIVAAASFGVFSEQMNSALYRLSNFNEAFIPPPPFTLSIEPMESKALRGDHITITVNASNPELAPREVTLRLKEARQENFDAYTLTADSSGAYRYEIPAIKRSVSFYAESPWYTGFVTSPTGSVDVLDRPDIRSISGYIHSPSYARLAPRPIDENSADVLALPGSRVELQLLSNKELSHAEAVLLKRNMAVMLASVEDVAVEASPEFDTVRIALTPDGRRATGAFTVNFSGEYYLMVTDVEGETNDNPIRYSVGMLSDAAPTISLIEPTSDVELSENAILPMKVVIADDYGFSSLKLHYRLVESEYTTPDEEFSHIDLSTPQNERALEVPYVWDLNSVGISPADRFQFYVEVFDNDVVNGPKSARTSTLTARLPSLDEIFAEAEQAQDMATKDLEKILKQAEEMKRDIDEVNRELRKQKQKGKIDWKEKKKIDDILKKQEDLQQKAQEIRENLEKMTQKLQQNQAISPETLEKYMQLQNLMKQVDAPELRKAMEKMQQAMDKASPEDLKKAVKDFEFNEEQFRQSIERTMKILKRLKAEQKTDELAKRAEEIEQKQNELEKKAENANANDEKKRNEMAQEQQNLENELDKMDKELGDLDKLMKELGEEDMPMAEMQKAQEELQKEQTKQAMQDAKRNMQKGDMKKAQQKQKQASQNLQKFAQQMQKLKEEMQKNLNEESIRQMRKAVQNMLSISKRQEQLKNNTGKLDVNSSQYREGAQQQADALQDLQKTAGQLMELSQKSFAVTPEMGKNIGDAMRKMQSAIQQMADRNAAGGKKSQGSAMGSINKATMQMQEALSNMEGQGGSCSNPGMGQGQGQGSGQGFMQSLGQMALQQQMINQAMQNHMEQMAGGQKQGAGGSQDGQGQSGQGRLQQIAGEQGSVQKSLQELAREQKDNADGQRVLGDLERIAEEMQEIVQDIQSGDVNEETLRRQERILSRLLNATRSTRQRDYEKNRKSRSGENFVRESPSEIDLTTQEGKTRALQELLRSIQQGYTKDYEHLIRQYFEALQKIEIAH